ncbi:MAG TPA: glycine betaine ABC transporter substrate-binding protein [Solirubrobacteraceae bacterium]|nr:glycine betaine ABC transporter substrate-binding protein [Solirubrobacteraceae bacterium]
MPARVLTLALTALLLLLAGCGGGDGDERPEAARAAGDAVEAGGGGGSIKPDPAHRGVRLTIGSKNFAEQYVLAEIYAQALRAAGFTVATKLDLGPERVAYKALKAGKVDAYPEYTGTALTSFYGVATEDVSRDPARSFASLRRLARRDGLVALPQTPFQNTFVVTSTKETGARLGNPITLSELAERVGRDARLSAYPECEPRPDCFVGLGETYDWRPRLVVSERQYEDLDAGRADFTMGFGTDGALTLNRYRTYEDDLQLFPPYYVTLLTRTAAADKLGRTGRAVIERVQAPLSEETMRELNSRVSLDGDPPDKVAADFLRAAGFTG